MENIKKRLSTKLESEGAEFLVLGHMLLEKITAYKAYVNFPGYDLIAVDVEQKKTARIQVKSRYYTNWDGFIIDSFESDFVVLVPLNRGYSKPKKNGDMGIMEPVFYVMPISYVIEVHDPENDWGKIVRNRLIGIEQYKNNWNLIKEYLSNNE